MNAILENIYEGLKLDKPEVLIPWNLTNDQVEDLNLAGKFVHNKSIYDFDATINLLPFVKKIGFVFENKYLSTISLYSNDDFERNGLNIKKSFEDHQKCLNSVFEKKGKEVFFFPHMSEEDEKYKWSFKKIVITHHLWNRFGLQINLIIKIKKHIDWSSLSYLLFSIWR